MFNQRTILVTGGAGYVGSALVPALLEQGHRVIVYDLFIYNKVIFSDLHAQPNLQIVKADIRDQVTFTEAVKGVDVVMHLACISNDPSFELDPELGKSINFDAFEPLVKIAKDNGVKRFIYASSSSVYGVKEEEQVIETLSLEPLTDYSKYKALCEDILLKYSSPDFTTITVRPATVCGYAPRLRLDVIVNILTNHAYHNRVIKVFGGDQYRPNINIKDMVRFYQAALGWEGSQVNGGIYNAGGKNYTVIELANMVKSLVGNDVRLDYVSTNDNRSYRVSSEKLKHDLGFQMKFSIDDAIGTLIDAFKGGQVPESMSGNQYFNIKCMNSLSDGIVA